MVGWGKGGRRLASAAEDNPGEGRQNQSASECQETACASRLSRAPADQHLPHCPFATPLLQVQELARELAGAPDEARLGGPLGLDTAEAIRARNRAQSREAVEEELMVRGRGSVMRNKSICDLSLM